MGNTGKASRRVTLGSWISVGHPAVAELMASIGWPWTSSTAPWTRRSALARCKRNQEPKRSPPGSAGLSNPCL